MDHNKIKNPGKYVFSIILEAHLPFPMERNNLNNDEITFFETVSETLLPLLEVLTRLENDHIQYRLGLVLSPVLCHLLSDPELQEKYLEYVDLQIEFGKQEMERNKDVPEIYKLAQNYYNTLIDRRFIYTEKYEKNLLKAFDFFRRRGKLEILASCATHAYLPLIAHNAESIQAQMETPVPIYRKVFKNTPHGFFLPCFGWTPLAESFLHAYNYAYTILDTHGILYGQPAPEKGTFYPVKTAAGTYIFGRDYYSLREIEKISSNENYRNNNLDAGYELPSKLIHSFSGKEGERHRTGYKYMANLKLNGINTIYNPAIISKKIEEHVRYFLEKTIDRLKEATKYMDIEEIPICVHANKADNFGRLWHEGHEFLEKLFRMAAGYRDFSFMNPSEYIYKQNSVSKIQIIEPAFSSCGINGYSESWLNESNDKMFSHLTRAMERMTELAERFPDDSGIKERTLNQAAREILLAQSSEGIEREMCLRNFTTIYESLASNYISTEWLTNLEKNHNIFPKINYRVFRRKK